MNSGQRERVERRLAAILAADVAGYSRLMGEDEEGTLAALKAIRRELGDPKIKEHRGRIVKTTGDGLLVEFSSVVDAVRCAVEVQREMAERNAAIPPARRIEFRMGINLGDIIKDGRDIYGDGVNVAARLEALAEPGGISVSRVVRDQVRDKLDFAFEDSGEQQVKNIARPVRVYRIPIAEQVATRTPLPLPEKPSLAVLPFQNMSGDPEQEYFADGIVEDITTGISRLPWLFVIARNSSFTYKGKAVDVKQVARELGVRYVLEGSVRKAANRVRITGQLIDTTSGAHIWADRFDGALDDIFELQDQVASGVVGAIEPKLRQSEIERATRKPTESLDAYDLYLRALAAVHQLTSEGIENAVRQAERALEIDPSYAPAAGLAARCRVYQVQQGWARRTPELEAAALHLARHAIDTGKDDPDALWMAGHIIAVFSGDHKAGAAAIERALLLNPNAALAWTSRGWVHLFLDEADHAIAAFERASRLSPLDPQGYSIKGGLARAHLTAGRYEEAMRWVDQTILEHPRYTPTLWMKVVLYELMGRPNEACEALKPMLEAWPGFTIEAFTAYAKLHYTPRLRAIYVEALRKAGLPEE
jgi:TolB-like protein/class 3 adenylate cyclase/tetratricopeptide (TPR) repeat protein